jgi:glycerol-3-phosphate dehydrogenase (NAD(P)+)
MANPGGLSNEHTTVSVIGGGAWGTALACHAARKGHDTLIWALEPEVAQDINALHENRTYLKVREPLAWLGSCPVLAAPGPAAQQGRATPTLPPCPLQGFPLPEALRASNDLKEVAQHGELVLMVIPTPFIERTMSRIADDITDKQARASSLKQQQWQPSSSKPVATGGSPPP